MNGEPIPLSPSQENDRKEFTEEPSYRYPGARSFSDNGVDHRLFFGREQEQRELLHQVRACPLLVVFGKSGLGKTSLLQAGLYPHLREQAFLPIPVRLDRNDIPPVQAVFESVRVTCAEFGVEYEPGEREGLWEFFKSRDFWRGEILHTPVLVFDQFEEIFTLRSGQDRAHLASALGELVSRGLPPRIKKGLTLGERPPFSDTPPNVKIILSLREEYIGALEQLVPDMPTIFGRRFRLPPLTRECAEKAVMEPAALPELPRLLTKPFTFKPAALRAIMDFLVNKQGEVEPFQLQIICGHIERQVEGRQHQGTQNVEVDEGLVGGRKAMEGLLQHFYRDALRMLPVWSFPVQRSTARRLCENGLVSPDGHRVSMEEGQIRKQFKTRELSLKTLTKARLLRKESRPGLDGFYYELSHDSLTGPVMKSRQFRRWRNGGLWLLLLLVLGGSWLWDRGTLKNENASFTTAYSTALVDALKLQGVKSPVVVDIPAGSFRQGDEEEDGVSWSDPVREVSIPAFSLSQYEVTFDEYDQFAAATGRELPSDEGWGRGKRPVINVSWKDAHAYAQWLSEKTGNPYRLPTESEWEYAARSGAKQDVFAGTSEVAQLSGFGVYADNSSSRTAEVGSKEANEFGLQDMSGNVWEWVEDCWHDHYQGAPTDGVAWLEQGGGDCTQRVVRGGSWGNKPEDLRASNRGRDTAGDRSDDLGVRLAQGTR